MSGLVSLQSQKQVMRFFCFNPTPLSPVHGDVRTLIVKYSYINFVDLHLLFHLQ